MRRWDVVTFDCYGTLIDWDRGIAAAFRAALAADRVSLDLHRVLAAYHELEPVVQAETFRNYRDVLTETARRVAARLGWALPETRARFLPESLPGWTPFADTNAALERIARAGCRLGILSNVDDDLLAGTRRHFTAAFDPELIITAQQVRAYKPAAAHFEAARARLGGQRWLHTAQSYFHDVVPARNLDIPVAWINRKGETPPQPSGAVAEFRTLSEFADWMTAGESSG
jgi:2-haloalkanoic acid dehalogenase type II